jgi:ribonuclease HI
MDTEELDSMTAPVSAYFDGLCEPANPGGYACGGWLIETHPAVPAFASPRTGGSFYVRGAGATNNVAEYRAALEVLHTIQDAGYDGHVVLHGDSQLVVKQFNGEWQCRKPELQVLLAELRGMREHFSSLGVVWVPREENAVADEASRAAYQRIAGGTAAMRH